MTETRYHELLGRLLDDSLSDPDAEALRDELARNPDRLRDVREHLMLSEFLSQEQVPHRAADAFWEGIRASLDADASVKTSNRRSLAFRAAALLAAVGIA
jgi:anti-sigma factor RsiW